jgi:hypothetical protein
MSATPWKSYPQPEEKRETGSLLVGCFNKQQTNNNKQTNAACKAASAINFATGTGLTQVECRHLAQVLQFHPDGQTVADELAGQVRARGRGPEGIRNPRALAQRLAREATARGVERWRYAEVEAELRGAQAPVARVVEPERPMAQPETIERARVEARLIKERHAARLAQGGGR